MKRFGIIFSFVTVLYFFLSHLACDKHPVSTPFPPPTMTPTNTPVFTYVQMTGSMFVPDPVTITASNGVIWTNMDPYGHTIQTDDGTGLCGPNQFINNPGQSVTIVFPSPATINYHCWIHSNCIFGPSPGSMGCDPTCGGPGVMAGTIVVQ